MDAALLGLRVLLALACVLGLIWFTGRRLQGTATVRKQRSVPLSVLGRQSLGKGAGIALVEVAGRVLLLGVGDQGVRVLTEVDLPAEPVPAQRTAEVRVEIDLSTLPADAVATAADLPATDDVATDADDVATDADDVATGTDDTGTDEATATPESAVTPAAEDAPETAAAADGVPTPHADGSARLAALAGLAATSSSAQAGALQGSVLSPDTWRRAVDVVQRRTARR